MAAAHLPVASELQTLASASKAKSPVCSEAWLQTDAPAARCPRSQSMASTIPRGLQRSTERRQGGNPGPWQFGAGFTAFLPSLSRHEFQQVS